MVVNDSVKDGKGNDMERMMVYAGSVGTPAVLGNKAKGSISGRGEGVYSLLLNEDGSLENKGVVYSDNAGIICMSNSGKYVYAANESRDFTGFNASGGGVTAMKINEDGVLEKINDSISYGSRSSYVCVSDDDCYLLVSNHGSHTTATCHYVKNSEGKYVLQRGYDDSSLACFALNEDGSIGELRDLVVFDGHGYWIDGGGQSGSHLHSVRYHKGLVFCGNRGSDRIEILRLESDGKLTLLNRFRTRPALAPRHIDFHPVLDLFYVANENYACVSVYHIDYENGEVHEMQMLPTMPEDYIDENPIPLYDRDTCLPGEINTSAMADFSRIMPSDIHVSKDGRLCFVANRCMKGIASIASYTIGDDGKLTFMGINTLDGGDPRGFNLLPDGEHLIVGLLDKDLVSIYRYDENGMFIKQEHTFSVPSCASFVFKR